MAISTLIAEIKVKRLGTGFLLGGKPYSFGMGSKPFMLIVEPDDSVWWFPVKEGAL